MKGQVKEPGHGLTLEDIREIIRIAEARETLIDHLKEALLAGKTLEALKLAREVCGLSQETTH
jgi:hypothetical protein